MIDWKKSSAYFINLISDCDGHNYFLSRVNKKRKNSDFKRVPWQRISYVTRFNVKMSSTHDSLVMKFQQTIKINWWFIVWKKIFYQVLHKKFKITFLFIEYNEPPSIVSRNKRGKTKTFVLLNKKRNKKEWILLEFSITPMWCNITLCLRMNN